MDYKRMDDLMVPPSARENGDKVTAMNASEFELLMMVAGYLRDTRAHPRLIEAVKRAGLRLLRDVEGNGHA